ncbi:MAG: hypothetical protein KBA91_00435 [Candidatus Moranbacteria bacterium]|nr:hypothetical protein [Candidatus Moranbacteria bacterium]
MPNFLSFGKESFLKNIFFSELSVSVGNIRDERIGNGRASTGWFRPGSSLFDEASQGCSVERK